MSLIFLTYVMLTFHLVCSVKFIGGCRLFVGIWALFIEIMGNPRYSGISSSLIAVSLITVVCWWAIFLFKSICFRFSKYIIKILLHIVTGICVVFIIFWRPFNFFLRRRIFHQLTINKHIVSLLLVIWRLILLWTFIFNIVMLLSISRHLKISKWKYY